MSLEEFSQELKTKFPHTSSFKSGLALFFSDTFSLIISIGFGFLIVNIFDTSDINFRSFLNYSIFVPFILVFFACLGLYPGIMSSSVEDIRKFAIGIFCSFLMIIVSVFFVDKNSIFATDFIIQDSSSVAIIISLIIAIPTAIVLLPCFREVIKHLFSRFKWWGVPSVLFVSDESAYFIVDRLIKNKYLGYHTAVIINSNITESQFYKGIPIFSPSNEIFAILKNHNVKQAIITDYQGDVEQIMNSFRYTITISKRQNSFTTTQQIKDLAGIICFSSTHNLTFKEILFTKRLLDLFILLFCSPFILIVMLILAILTKITSKGPVFYGHKRIGKNGKEIKCWKFRSMCINSQEILEEILRTDEKRREEWEKDRKFVDDPRVTKFGKFLRKTSLDELPQVFNILKGDMSLVGPRPVTEPELVKYGEYKDYVLSVSPGLSGMWQISGRSDTGYEERITFDKYYIQNWSIWLDIWILIKTVWIVIIGKGAY